VENDPLGFLLASDRLTTGAGRHRHLDGHTRQLSIRVQVHGPHAAAVSNFNYLPEHFGTAPPSLSVVANRSTCLNQW
jgi:hypothetical protein